MAELPAHPAGARTLALGTPDRRPAWLRATEGERRWWIVLALIVAIGSQFVMPSRFVLHPAYIVPGVEAVLLAVLAIMHPDRLSERTQRLRIASQVLLAVIAIVNAVSLSLLIRTITTGHHIAPVTLLVGGGEIWLTNTIVFALWYWEYDRGGPAARAHGTKDIPDLLFPQLTDEHLARNWEPIFGDYLYVSFTNSTAFSPTDTMPLSRWSKLLFALQASISLVTVALIAARAVNILPGQ
ncbi:MAG TPA: hypothetical protein VH373_19735 [Jatrophihabitantaceae bacterium]